MSLYIPHVFANIGEKKMVEVFASNGIGKVNHIDFVTKIGKDNKVYHSAYVHFDYWYDNIASRNIQEKLNAGKEAKIVYDDPWYWKAYKNETKKFGGNGQRKERLVIEKEELNPISLRRLTYEDIFEEPPKEANQEFTQEELDEIERNLLAEFEVEDFSPRECYDLVDANYVAILESRLAFYEGRLTCV
jgi:acyl-[acyl carrier protein]--UDP-N-acetylglucosamine O-acyltransferase